MNPKQMKQAQRLYKENQKYVDKNIDKLSTKELAIFAKQQDQLYLRAIGEKR